MTVTHHRLCEQLQAEAVGVGEALAGLTGEEYQDAAKTLAYIREDIAHFHPDTETCRKVSTTGIATAVEDIIRTIRNALDLQGITMDKIDGEENETFGIVDRDGERYFLTIEPV